MLLDFRTTMVTDGNADHTEEEHAATLIAFCSKFGDIASSEELMARSRLENAREVRLARACQLALPS